MQMPPHAQVGLNPINCKSHSASTVLEPPIIYRIKRLRAVGYLPAYSFFPVDPEALWFAHISKKRAERQLILYSDGWLVGVDMGSSARQLRISPEDDEGFEKFIKSVSVPTFWERTALFRVKLLVLL